MVAGTYAGVSATGAAGRVIQDTDTLGTARDKGAPAPSYRPPLVCVLLSDPLTITGSRNK